MVDAKTTPTQQLALVRGVQRGVHMSRVGLLVLVTVVASGCTMAPTSRRTLLVGGLGLTVGGVAVVRAGATDSDGSGQNDIYLNDDFRLYYAGSLMVLTGIVAIIGALSSRERIEPPILEPAASVRVLTPSTVASPISIPEPEPMADAPRTIERIPAIPLPDVTTTDTAHRLARQLRSASMHGHCDVAWIMWRDLEKLDGPYARAVRDSAVMARCAR